MCSDKRYLKNLKIAVSANPQLIDVEKDRTEIEFNRTLAGEINFIHHGSNLYGEEGAIAEANQWASILPFEKFDTLFVYGIGLGYYYLPLKQWLQENDKHRLVFIEKDPTIIRAFFHTKLATEILKHKQIHLFFFPFLQERPQQNLDAIWQKLRSEADPVFWAFSRSKPHLSALQSYFANDFVFFDQFVRQWSWNLSQTQRLSIQYLEANEIIFRNQYANLPYLSESILFSQIEGHLQGLPAILCGAGPSLTPQLPILPSLKDKAFIAASGSAMNVVTQANVKPHLGGGVDQTSTQASRQMTSYAYEVPLFYQTRYYAEALRNWHGPKIYVSDREGYRINEWFDKQLGIEPKTIFFGGISTSNFLMEIIGALGCDPLVLVGMDLAYTDGERYAQGVTVHATDDLAEKQALTHKEKGVEVKGLTGNPVYTKPGWFMEAMCMAGYQRSFPERHTLNASAEGMPIPEIPHVDLGKVIESKLQNEYDIQGWWHAVIQNASQFMVPREKLMATIDLWSKSLESCANLLEKWLKAASEEERRIIKAQLVLESVYEYFLQTLEMVYEKSHPLQMMLKKVPSLHKQLKHDQLRFKFLLKNVKEHLKAIRRSFKHYTKRQKLLAKKNLKTQLPIENVLPNYVKGTDLFIDEPGIHLQIQADLKDANKKCRYYSGGQLYAEAYYENEKLHGPCSFYGEKGQLLSRSHYVHGLKEGKVILYYSDGKLYSLQNYRHGVAQGEHLYYYPNGVLRTREYYEQGKFHGVVQLYFENGKLKKEQHFSQGFLQGRECIWDEYGHQLLEAHYEKQKPIGKMRRWLPNGTLIQEITHE